MIRAASLLCALAFPVLLGCEEVPDIVTPDTPQVATGRWQGNNLLGRFEMVLAEDAGGAVSGGGFLRDGNRNLAFDISGANAFPQVALSLRFGGEAIVDPRIGAELVSYRGQFDASGTTLSLFGRLNGGLLHEVALRVTRN